MKITKIQLLAATIIAGMASSAANAQFAFPSADIRGVGASAPGDINVKVQNCIGADSNLGSNAGTTSVVTLTDYTPTTPSATNPRLLCSAGENVYNSTGTYTGQYVATGSGFGRQQWRNFVNNFSGLAGSINPFGTWANVQYAFSEAPATPSDITDYQTDNAELINGVDVDVNAQAQAGNAIQFPFYVVPVAFAFNNVYGNNGGTDLRFNIRFPQNVNGVAAGGIRLTKAAYCGIWNGSITNWNNATLRTLNGNTDLRDAVNDSSTRWASEGVPIRLVGRADRSGTSDLFTRAMAAQCGTTVTAGGTNKFERAAESLPYDPASTIDIRGLRADTSYRPGNAASNFAGPTQSLNGYVYDRTNNRFCFWNEAASAACSATPAPVTFAQFQTGGTSAGLFIVADGSAGVEAAVRRNDGVNAALTSPSVPTLTLNGKLGYIGADFVAGSTGRTLFSAALQRGTTTAYVMPTATNASQAFGSVRPPQASAASGAYDTVNDTRQVFADLTNPAAGTQLVDRANPLHWVNVLYPPSGPTLANPTTGYPVTGASNLLMYTCYSDIAKRSAMANFVGYVTGKVTRKNAIGGVDNSITLNTNTFKGVGATSLGILAKSNIAPLPAGWANAVWETFFRRSTQASNGVQLGTRNLWIQSAQPTTAAMIDGLPTGGEVLANPGCAGLPGA